MTKESFGSAWCPQIGRIHICQKHVAAVNCGEEVEMEVYLHPEAYHFGNHWISTGRFERKLSSGPWNFIREIPGVIFGEAYITHINPAGFGFMKLTERPWTGIYFCSEDFNGWSKGMNVKDVLSLGSRWQVIIHPQKGLNQEKEARWRALAILPRESLESPPASVYQPEDPKQVGHST